MILNVKTQTDSYNIVLQRGSINSIAEFYNINKKALIVTDDGVPQEYAQVVSAQFKNAVIKVIPQGEGSKSFDTYVEVLKVLHENEFSREDCVVAVGGGVVGDLSGFVASTYLRGIDFVNVPTTLLSQVDSSIGGKTAIDFGGYKNTVGAFYQPKVVIIDPNTLKTLSNRQLNNGLSECIKMALTSDAILFDLLENENAYENIDQVIERSLKIKRAVVQEDEKEQGLRRVLNFGHTLGHAIESATGMQAYLHGECVALGMLPFTSPAIREQVKNVLLRYQLPVNVPSLNSDLVSLIRHDKKANASGVNTVFVNDIGSFDFKFMEFSELEEVIKEAYIQ